MNRKTTAVLLIIAVMLIAAVVCIFLAGRNIKKNDEPEEPEDGSVVTVINTAAPSPSAGPDSSSGIIAIKPQTGDDNVAEENHITRPGAETEPRPEPSATPEPPEEEPAPAVAAKGSGTLRSDSGAKINIRTEYEWRSSEGASDSVEVTIKVILESYSLHLSAVPKSVVINLDGQYISLDAPEVDYDGSELLTTTLAEKTFTADIPADGRLPVSVEWHFGGSYSGVDLDVIECSGTIDLNS